MTNTNLLKITGGLVSLTLLAGCSTGVDNKIAAGSTDECSAVLVALKGDLRAQVKALQDGSAALLTATSGNASITPETVRALEEASTAATLAGQQLDGLLKIPNAGLPLETMKLETLVDVAGEAQNRALALAERDMGKDLNAVLTAGAQVNGDLEKTLVSLQAKVDGLRGNVGLSAEAKAALTKLSVELEVLAKELDRTLAVDVTDQVHVQGALDRANTTLLDVKGKVGATLGNDAVAGLTLDAKAAAEDAAKKVPTGTSVEGTVQGTVDGTVKSTVPAVTAPSAGAKVQGTVEGAVKTVTPSVTTPPVTTPGAGVNVNVNAVHRSAAPVVPVIPQVAPSASTTVNGTVNALGL